MDSTTRGQAPALIGVQSSRWVVALSLLLSGCTLVAPLEEVRGPDDDTDTDAEPQDDEEGSGDSCTDAWPGRVYTGNTLEVSAECRDCLCEDALAEARACDQDCWDLLACLATNCDATDSDETCRLACNAYWGAIGPALALASAVSSCSACQDDSAAGADPAELEGCDDSCEFASDGECDEDRVDFYSAPCELGTDCTDCGPLF